MFTHRTDRRDWPHCIVVFLLLPDEDKGVMDGQARGQHDWIRLHQAQVFGYYEWNLSFDTMRQIASLSTIS